MGQAITKDTWVFAVIQDPGGSEHYLGLHDEASDVSYIPVFQNKEEAQDCLLHLPKERGKKYEIQAVILEDIARDALKNRFVVFLLDGEGKIVDKTLPCY